MFIKNIAKSQNEYLPGDINSRFSRCKAGISRPSLPRLKELVEDPLVVVDQQRHWKDTGEEDDRYGEAQGEVDKVGPRKHEGADV